MKFGQRKLRKGIVMNTLKGIFPEPKSAPKRNFLKENKQQIKQMQGIIQSTREAEYQQPVYPTKRQPLIVYRRNHPSGSNAHNLKKSSSQRCVADEKPKTTNIEKNKSNELLEKKIENPCCRTAVESLKMALRESKKKDNRTKENWGEQYQSEDERPSLKIRRDVGIQTETSTKNIYETGIVVHPQIMSVRTKQKSLELDKYDRQTLTRPITTQETKIDSPKAKDFVRENAQPVPTNRNKFREPQLPPGNAPVTYKKGVVPKYIKERKEELFRKAQSTAGDERCPDGHVMLPEHERKETLRMLRQSYAELITELNLMPVRSDTLKIRNRKIELENQLKKLDEGIKVFTRPKVFVKIGA